MYSSPIAVAWADAIRDVRDGALATARMIVTLSGVIALLLGAVVVGSDELRTTITSALPFQAPMLALAADEPASAPESEAVAAKPAAAPDPRQKPVVQYLSRRYRVAEGATKMLVSAAFEIGREKNLDPLLILSVVAIESSLNPFAESSMGAQGLMQVMTRVHANRFSEHGGELAALDPIANMKVGSEILRDVIARGGSVERGLQLYVGAGNLPDDGGYAAKVLGERGRLAMAAAGKVEAAIAAGRAPAPEPKAATVQVSSPPAKAIPVDATT
jgi:soluble lytic murein transglycosylase-like protein